MEKISKKNRQENGMPTVVATSLRRWEYMAACQGNLRPCKSKVLLQIVTLYMCTCMHTHTQTHTYKKATANFKQGPVKSSYFARGLPQSRFRSNRKYYRECSVRMDFRIRRIRVKILLSLFNDQLLACSSTFLASYFLICKTGIKNSP